MSANHNKKYHQKKDYNLPTILLLVAITIALTASILLLIDDNDTQIPQKEVTIILDAKKILADQSYKIK